MSTGSESLRDKHIISDDEISARIDYLAFLEDDELFDSDRDLWADEIEELAALRALVADGSEFGGLVAEYYFTEYATDDANDLFDLEKTGAYKYFDYETYADDLQTEYSQVEFLGTTYYYQGG